MQNVSFSPFDRIATCICLAPALLSLLLVGCSSDSGPATPAVPEVSVVEVEQRDLPISAEFVGQTVGAVDADVRARIEGVVLGMHFEEGKEVTEGQLLYTLDDAPFRANLAVAQGRLAEETTRLVKAEADLKRIRPLAEMKAVSERDLDAAVAQHGVAQAGVDAAKAGVDAAEIEVSYAKITAPVSGIIGISKARVGELVGRPPNSVILNTVSQLDPIHVRFAVSEKEYLYFARLRQKQIAAGETPEKRSLELIFSDGSSHQFPGEIASIDRQIDAQTGSLSAEARFPNPDQLVRPGQFAKIKTTRETAENAILIPKRAVQDLQGLKKVFVLKDDNSVEQRTIETGEEINELVLVDQGLVAGDTIVIEGQQRLRSGMTVKIKNV